LLLYGEHRKLWEGRRRADRPTTQRAPPRARRPPARLRRRFPETRPRHGARVGPLRGRQRRALFGQCLPRRRHTRQCCRKDARLTPLSGARAAMTDANSASSYSWGSTTMVYQLAPHRRALPTVSGALARSPVRMPHMLHEPAFTAFPRVLSSEAFGRRPYTRPTPRARAGIRNPSGFLTFEFNAPGV
jgi:hypothetical protein